MLSAQQQSRAGMDGYIDITQADKTNTGRVNQTVTRNHRQEQLSID